MVVAVEVRRCKCGCGMEAAPRRQLAEECWLRKQPPMVRRNAAKQRLALIPEAYRIATVHKSKWPEGRRFCAGCQTFVLLEDCAGSRCKACASVASHRATVRAKGIDDATHQWLQDVQLGKCAGCRRRPSETELHIDHYHGHAACGGTGCPECVRGLLCKRCNHDALVAVKHDPATLRNLANYLDTPPMSGEWEPPASEVEEWRAKHPDQPIVPF